jgi:NAD(P)-dependent dehydrogenase (short-subunit alcohol dehydrogenase family)
MSILLVLGATGSCGRHFVRHAVNAGYSVRCLVRDPSRVTSEGFEWAQHPQVDLRRGELTDSGAVAAACEGVAAVICMVGPPPGASSSPLAAAVRNVAAGMRAHGVRRLIVQGGGFTRLDGAPTATERVLRRAFELATGEAAMLAGNDEAARFIAESCADLDWTVTRPGMLDERPSSGVVEADHDYGSGPASARIGKIDLTRWYLDLLDDPRSHRAAPAPRYAAEDFGFARERVAGERRVAVITGGNSGLGFETARGLLMHGMRVVLACRDPGRGNSAAAALRVETRDRADADDADVVFEQLDTSSIGSVRAFADRYLASGRPLHVLLCNAGIMMGPERVSADGIELQLATNYLGHFELCRLLQDRMVASAPARVIHVSSVAARTASLDPANLDRRGPSYSPLAVYGMTKLAQVVFSRELNRRLERTGVTSSSLEPGIVATNLSAGITDDPVMRARLANGVPVEVGARTQIMLAASMKVAGIGGGNWVDGRDVSRGLARLRYVAAAHSLRASMDAALWAASEALIEERAPARRA